MKKSTVLVNNKLNIENVNAAPVRILRDKNKVNLTI
jgi:hypothetical protein